MFHHNTGKTALARAVSKESNSPLYVVDIGAIFGSLVGESQRTARRALDVLRRAPHGVVLLDELEKEMAGVSRGSGKGDSGTSAQVGMYFLKYLNNPIAADGFHLILGTSNDIFQLPAEYTRAGRWDAIFWFGLPKGSALLEVLKMYRRKYGLPAAFGKDQSARTLDGLTPAEVEATCRIAALTKADRWDDAVLYVPRLAKFRAEEIKSMEAEASGRAISADTDILEEAVAASAGRRVR